MKIKELIDKLTEIQEKHGEDIYMRFQYSEYWCEIEDMDYYEFEEIKPVKMVVLR